MKCSVEKRHRERERGTCCVCARALLFPDQKMSLAFLLYLNGRRGKGKRDERERDSFASNTSLFFCVRQYYY